MAQLDVEKKKSNDWWKWLLGILAAIIIIWVIVEATGTEDTNEMEEMQRTTQDATTSYIDLKKERTIG